MSLLSQRRKLIEAERARKFDAKSKTVPSTQRTAADVAEAEEYLKKLSKEFGEQNARMNESLDPVKGTYIPSLKAAGDHKQNPMDRIQDKEGAKKLVEQDEKELVAEEKAKAEKAAQEEALKAAEKAEEEFPGDHDFEEEVVEAEVVAEPVKEMSAEEASANLVAMTQEKVAELTKENAEIEKEQAARKPKKRSVKKSKKEADQQEA